ICNRLGRTRIHSTATSESLKPSSIMCEEAAGSDKLDLAAQELQALDLEKLGSHGHVNNLRIITHLSLDYNSISHLPDDLCMCLPHLEVFSANGNNLCELPKQFGLLRFLREVHLNENSLSQLPDSIQYLVNLKVLRLTGNQLACLPVDFGEIGGLEELSVEENKLTRFPATFALLTNLRLLEAGHNRIKVLPKYLGHMQSLTHLDLCNNCLEEIPDSFGDLQNLVCVDLSRNRLKNLPSRCSAQKTLKKFYAGQNVIDNFPDWLGRLPELTTLCIKENMLTGICLPPDFGKVCKKLQHLNLCGNHLTELPESFGELESLEFVHFGSMLDEIERSNWVNGNWLQQLPASFPQLRMLTTLRLDENQIQFLPDDFGQLCNLESFNIGQNLLHDLPESFGELKRLRVCVLSRNNIQLLPSSFGSLRALEELRVDNNQLAEMPESFKELTQLKVLDLFHNRLSEVPACLSCLTQLQFLDLNQNPIKIPKKLIPSIARSNHYAPRDPKLKGTWRGRLRDKMDGFVDITNNAIRCSDTGDTDEDEVNEEVDELYGSEDIPYNSDALQRAAERALWGQSTWRSHAGPDVRPVFVRDSVSIPPRQEAPSDTSEDRGDDSSCSASERTSNHSQVSESMEKTWSSPPWAEVWDSHLVEETWDTPALEEDWDSGSVPSLVQQSVEENWGEELSDPRVPAGYSFQDFYNAPSNGFSYNPKLKGFFFLPWDLHARATPRPNKTRDVDSQQTKLVREDGQFSDAEDS
ncbi:hypothetical protein BaRGS_00001148, partial [Batillaria attramentaria]